MNVEKGRNEFPITHDTVPGKVQGPPLLRQHHNVALRLLHKSSFGPQSNVSLRTLLKGCNYYAVWWNLVLSVQCTSKYFKITCCRFRWRHPAHAGFVARYRRRNRPQWRGVGREWGGWYFPQWRKRQHDSQLVAPRRITERSNWQDRLVHQLWPYRLALNARFSIFSIGLLLPICSYCDSYYFCLNFCVAIY